MNRDAGLSRFRTLPWGALLVAVVIVALLAGIEFLTARHPGVLPVGQECAAAYHRARNATDTAIIDEQRPVSAREKTTHPISCGALRKAAELPWPSRLRGHLTNRWL